MKKRALAINDLGSVIEWMKRFNHEESRHGVKLKAQIFGKGNYSLLHSAVMLEQPGAVRTLLQLGANPCIKSSFGTVVEYSHHLVKSVRSNVGLVPVVGALSTTKANPRYNATKPVSSDGLSAPSKLLR